MSQKPPNAPEQRSFSRSGYARRLDALFRACLRRPELLGKTELVSLEWMLEMSNPNPSPTSDLGSENPGKRVTMPELTANILKNGMRDPLVIGVGLATSHCRLEAGNHRARILLGLGFFHAPAIALVGLSQIGFEGNGKHEGRPCRLWAEARRPLSALPPYREQYFERPSLIIPSTPLFLPED